MSTRLEKWGAHVPRVPQQIAPMSTVSREESAMIMKWSLHNHLVGYSKLVRQKQLRIVLLQLFLLAVQKVRYKFVFD